MKFSHLREFLICTKMLQWKNFSARTRVVIELAVKERDGLTDRQTDQQTGKEKMFCSVTVCLCMFSY